MSSYAPNASPLVAGYKLDRYELLCPIAEGGMASVWVARLQGKHGFEKLLAVKTILPKYASDLRFQHMFLDEARIASRIEHTNVAQILDLGEENSVLYLVMEWVDGDALSKLHRAAEEKGEMMPIGVVLRILADTCGGLHIAHELRGNDGSLLGVVHRDVSPQNVLVSARGVAKLIDFGIAKARDRAGGDTNTGFLKGKIQYMAPEQATGTQIDRRADVWAIGAILYHLLSGKPPFDGENQLAALHRLTSGRPPVPLSPRVPPAVAAVVRRALTHDPAKRYATTLEMQTAIEAAMVQAKLATTTADVAAFCAEHLADRAIARKQAVDGALKAAKERTRAAGLGSLGSISSTGLGSNPGIARVSENEVLLTVPEGRARSSPGQREAAMRSAPISESSSATLGSAGALASPMPVASGKGRGIAIAIVGGVVVLGAVAALAVVTLRGSNDATQKGSVSASAPPAMTSAAPIVPAAATTSAPNDPPAPDAGVAIAAPTKPKPAPFGMPVVVPTAKPSATAPPPKKKVDPDGF